MESKIKEISRLFLSLFLSLMLLLSNGCKTRMADQEKVTITWAFFGDPATLSLNQSIVQLFEDKHPNIKIKLQHITARGYDQKILTSMAAGIPPDVFKITDWQFHVYVDKGVLLDLTPYMIKDRDFDLNDFYPRVIEAFKHKDGIYGYPLQFAVNVLFYNKALFNKENLSYPNSSWTWQSLLDAAITLTKDIDQDGRVDQYGFVFDYGWPAMILPWIWQNGGDILNETGTKCIIDSREAVESLQFVSDLLNKYKVMPSRSGLREQGASKLFQSGRVGMYMCGIWAVNDLRKIKNFEWDIAPLPRQKRRASTLFAASVCIAKASKHPEQAWKLLKFLLSPEVMEMSLKVDNSILIRKSLASFYMKSVIPQGKNYQVAIDAAEYGFWHPLSPLWPRMDSIIGRELELVWLGRKSVRESCETIKAEIDALLK